MNKPAAKEPSMDEILSSIRQIIADEDQDGGVPAQKLVPDDEMAEDDHDAPLALSPQQMVDEPDSEPDEGPMAEVEAEDDPLEAMTVAEDVTFDLPDEPVEDDDEVASLANMLADVEEDVEEAEDEPEIVLGDDISFNLDEDEAPAPKPVMAQAAPMPDPDLSRDVAEKLLEPTTAAASKHAFNKLNQLAVGSSNMTIENMVREMLRPMLKSWLDENLPGVVEKLVEREIERVSRGS